MRPDERLAAARAAEAAGEHLKVALFWGHKPDKDGGTGRGCFSQWWPAPFTVAEPIVADRSRPMGAPGAGRVRRGG